MPAIESTKSKILETAMGLFYARGIKGTGVDLIIAEAGVHKSTFFKHYPTKASLVAAYLQLRDDRWMDWFIGRVEALARDPEDKLIVIFDALHEWFSQPDFRGCAFINAVAETADVAAFEFQISVEHKKRLELYITQSAKAANIRQSKQVVEQLLILIEGSIVRAQMEQTAKSALAAKSMAKMLLAKKA